MKPTCLLTNDDGPGALLDATIDTLSPLVSDLLVVVPSCNRSGVSAAVTLGDEFRVFMGPKQDVWLVSGFPSDGVRFAIGNLVVRPPGIVVSGANNGYNLGRCVVNSGTIGAAFEGARVGISAVCISTARHTNTGSSWRPVLRDVIQRCFAALGKVKQHGPLVISLNVPPDPTGEVECLPVSQVEFNEKYQVTERSPREMLVSVRGDEMIEDPAVPDIAALKRGAIVLNVLPTPWTVELSRAIGVLTREF